ncbi:MAG: hypothetical protein AB7P99_06640 [Vicinamibacterales bacterium]
MVEADFILQHPRGVIAARDGVIVYIGSVEDAGREVRRLRNAMRIDATGCVLLPAAGVLTVGGPLSVVIVKEDEPGTVRMEIANGKIVRWT